MLLRRNRLDEVERQLGGERLELDVVDGIVYERRHRHDGFRVARLAQQANGVDTDFLIGIAEVADDVFELRLLRVRRSRPHESAGTKTITRVWTWNFSGGFIFSAKGVPESPKVPGVQGAECKGKCRVQGQCRSRVNLRATRASVRSPDLTYWL